MNNREHRWLPSAGLRVIALAVAIWLGGCAAPYTDRNGTDDSVPREPGTGHEGTHGSGSRTRPGGGGSCH